jgi:hypothetical protein
MADSSITRRFYKFNPAPGIPQRPKIVFDSVIFQRRLSQVGAIRRAIEPVSAMCEPGLGPGRSRAFENWKIRVGDRRRKQAVETPRQAVSDFRVRKRPRNVWPCGVLGDVSEIAECVAALPEYISNYVRLAATRI